MLARQTVQPTVLPPFPNGATPTLDWPAAKVAIINLYTRCLPGRALGLIDAIMTTDDIRRYFKKPDDFEMTPLIEHPGDQPDRVTEFQRWDRLVSLCNAQILSVL